MLTLALVLALGQATGHGRPGGPIVSQPNTMGAFAAFEFAPANGRGMGAACSGAIPTGARGETLTFTRASSATCLKSASMTSNIAPGDMSTLSANQPRVMPGDNSGINGLLIERAQTNTILRSEELDNAAWTLTPGTGGTLPVVTANYAVGPDGATTAERIQYAAASGAQESVAFQAAGCGVGAVTGSIYVRGTSTSGSIDFILNLGGGNFACSTCSFVSTSWSRCIVSGTVASSGNFITGSEPTIAPCGTSARSAADVLVTKAQCEGLGAATSYIPTTTASVTRGTETATFSYTNALNTESIALSFIPLYTSPSASVNQVLALHDNGAAPFVGAYGDSSTARCEVNGSATVSRAFTFPSLGVVSRLSCAWTGTALTSVINGSSNTTSSAATIGSRNTVRIGSSFAGGYVFSGVIKQLCLDPDPARCR